jgi:hypothetical protein
LFRLFLDAYDSLKGEVENTAREQEIHLSARFEREFTYLLLYVFTTLLIVTATRENPASSADELVRLNLTRLSQLESVQLGALVQEYRNRFDHFRQIELFTTRDRFLVNEATLIIGRYLTGTDDMLFGAIAGGYLLASVGLLRESIGSLQA